MIQSASSNQHTGNAGKLHHAITTVMPKLHLRRRLKDLFVGIVNGMMVGAFLLIACMIFGFGQALGYEIFWRVANKIWPWM